MLFITTGSQIKSCFKYIVNTFLDIFVQYRHKLGLPASAIDIVVVDGIGYISQKTGMLQKMGGVGFKAVREQELLDALMVAMEPKRMGLGSPKLTSLGLWTITFVAGLSSIVSLNDPTNRATWRRDCRMAIYHENTFQPSNASAFSSSLRTFVASTKSYPSILKSPEASSFFANEIGKKLFQLLLKPVEDLITEMLLADLGVDSLLGIELRQRWRQVFGLDSSVLEMMGLGTLDALGKLR